MERYGRGVMDRFLDFGIAGIATDVESIARARDFAEIGADILFVEAPESAEELARFFVANVCADSFTLSASCAYCFSSLFRCRVVFQIVERD